jgi:rhamnose utilization protein RhaD (predicted bifunctional aldolase and dehydrogenase)/NAD(P)-dependent dehydrogenase (short-subunit alcohol dehydrogenase family)
MQSLWNDAEAQAFAGNELQLRVYTSRLLGGNPALVLHGGGNTSVKIEEKNLFGEPQTVIYVKASGHDLGQITAEGFAPVKLDTLLKLAPMTTLTDTIIVREQRAALLNPFSADPSVEAILHAIIPYKFVDHTHADALVTITNTPHGEDFIREIYGDSVVIIPYIMPGYQLMRGIYELTQGGELLKSKRGMILMKHGIFTFANDVRTSYETMIEMVTQAEQFLAKKVIPIPMQAREIPMHWHKGTGIKLAQLRKAISVAAKKPLIARLETTPESAAFSELPNVADIATRGCLTPDHIIRTRRVPLILDGNAIPSSVAGYVQDYQAYFERHATPGLVMLDPAPRWAIWQGVGNVMLGETVKAADMAADCVRQTLPAIQAGMALDDWQPVGEKDLFAVEYWELEQAKLKNLKSLPPFSGKIALVTGAASGIGKACAELLHQQGAAVVALDINPTIAQMFQQKTLHGIVCDVTDSAALQNAIYETVRLFGGLDIVVANAGIFPPAMSIEDMDAATWQRSLNINLTAQQQVFQATIPYLKHGMNPTIIVIGSRNVPAPGPKAAAYSVAKAGLTQLARVAALELAGDGVRVNIIHPDAVFDTGIWTPEILEKRAASYGLTVEQYKTKNLLHAEITSESVAKMVCALAGEAFYNTTGAQISLDGGSDRVI